MKRDLAAVYAANTKAAERPTKGKDADNLDDVAEWLSYGKLRGLGQWRGVAAARPSLAWRRTAKALRRFASLCTAKAKHGRAWQRPGAPAQGGAKQRQSRAWPGMVEHCAARRRLSRARRGTAGHGKGSASLCIAPQRPGEAARREARQRHGVPRPGNGPAQQSKIFRIFVDGGAGTCANGEREKPTTASRRHEQPQRGKPPAPALWPVLTNRYAGAARAVGRGAQPSSAERLNTSRRSGWPRC